MMKNFLFSPFSPKKIYDHLKNVGFFNVQFSFRAGRTKLVKGPRSEYH